MPAWTSHLKFRLLWSAALLGAGTAIGALTIAYISAGEIYEYNDTFDGVHLPKVDAVVCLAGGRGRIAAAGDIWYRYWEQSDASVPPEDSVGPAPGVPPVLYISGMGAGAGWSTLAKQVRRGVIEILDPSHVVLENESANTEENALWLARYASEKGWKRVLLITSRYHMRRARMIFGRTLAALKQPIAIETLSVYQEPFEPGEWRQGLHGTRVTLDEYLKWLYYRYVWRGPSGGPIKASPKQSLAPSGGA